MNTKQTIVVLETNVGNLEVVLFPKIAPKTCENFLGLVDKGYYQNVIFHRVIKNFMIQGGDPTGTGLGGESVFGGKFKDEFSKEVSFNRPGILAMANAGPNTNGSQFFITTAATPWLDQKHTIFGEITPESKDILKKIDGTKTTPQDRPVEEIKIIKAYVKQ
jgi:peptidylprolyl isomerase